MEIPLDHYLCITRWRAAISLLSLPPVYRWAKATPRCCHISYAASRATCSSASSMRRRGVVAWALDCGVPSSHWPYHWGAGVTSLSYRLPDVFAGGLPATLPAFPRLLFSSCITAYHRIADPPRRATRANIPTTKSRLKERDFISTL